MQTWRYLADDGVSASFGLAADEHLMQGYRGLSSRPPTLRLYTYKSHSALVGRFQNVAAELRVEECRRQGVDINRRPTGGGAIVMGEGQLGVALITSTSYPETPSSPLEAFKTYAQGVLQGLKELGIEAEFRPKNDIEVGGKKIAGMGLYIDEEGALLFHTSLLVDLDVAFMLRVLNIPLEKISDKEIASFEERLTTVSRELGRKMKAPEVRESIRGGFEKALGIRLEARPFTQEERAAIGELERTNYTTEEWIYQRAESPDMVGRAIKKTEAGLLRVSVALAGKVIKNVLITGDFLSTSQTINDIEAALKWASTEEGEVARIVAQGLEAPGRYILGLPPETLSQTILEAISQAKVKGGI